MEKEFLEYLESEKKIINNSIQNYFQQAIQDEDEPFLTVFHSSGRTKTSSDIFKKHLYGSMFRKRYFGF